MTDIEVIEIMVPVLDRLYDRGTASKCQAVLDALNAAGLVVVPKEPTEAMRSAGGNILHIQGRGGELQANRMYKVMIAELSQ